KSWIPCNIVAVILVLIFISIYFVFRGNDDACFNFGVAGMDYLNREYYRWITCLFLHYNIGHLFVNFAALLSMSSLFGSFLKKRQFFFLFMSGGILAEIAYSIVISDQIYDIGASSGIFALIACLVVCILRFPEQFHVIWYRLNVII
ncbi:MAG: rhomboid family intramembrane serine protease, partial [Clostridiales bacterium]|nr:rhomboid family intramembrane serine protease [Clostridiales bacterium]